MAKCVRPNTVIFLKLPGMDSKVGALQLQTIVELARCEKDYLDRVLFLLGLYSLCHAPIRKDLST